MLSSLVGWTLSDPHGPSALAVSGFWVLSLGGLGLWCGHLSRRVTALVGVSTLDPLTGLGNGRLFESERWPSALRSSAPLAVLFIDLDHLKQTNDRFGRVAGDRYIVRAAAALRGGCRRGIDEIFRLHTAGDEFMVVVRGPDAVEVATIADNILGRLRQEGLSASIGAAWTLAGDHRERSELLDAAERAMRKAKSDGKGRAVVVAIPARQAVSDSDPPPEPIEEDWTNPRRRVNACDQAAAVLHSLRDDVRIAFPAHRITIGLSPDLPPLAVDEGRFTLAIMTLLLHVASISRHIHITAGVGTRTGLQPNAPGDSNPLLRVCVEFSAERPPTKPALLSTCQRICVQEGGAWTVQSNCICLGWPIRAAVRPSEPTLRLVADPTPSDALSTRAGGTP